MRGFKRLYIPEPLGAALVLLILVGATGYGVYQLSEPAAGWIAKAPESLRRIEQKLIALRKPVEQVSKATEQVEKITKMDDGKKTQVVELKDPGLSNLLLNQTPGVIIGTVTMFILLYFFLASGDLFLLKLVRVLPTLKDKKRAVEIVRQIEQNVSTYLFTVTMINAGLGVAVGLAMFFLQMPNPLLWGVMAGFLEFIPYLGPTVGLTVLTLVALLTFENLGHALLVSAVYLGLTAIQGNFIAPMVLGRRLTLNPMVIFIALIFWGWIWGIPGALLAVPMLATFKIFCDHIEPLTPIGEFLGK
ncbi:MAG: AI-2E family transporter [Candidatus Dadabacteria bacterium]|nr:AI-2E family transporter [Candidatus Dadabacteria bacterium]